MRLTWEETSAWMTEKLPWAASPGQTPEAGSLVCHAYLVCPARYVAGSVAAAWFVLKGGGIGGVAGIRADSSLLPEMGLQYPARYVQVLTP
jgi:hypothetical protein